MAKWFGKVGYDTKVEIEPGIWKSKITEVEYFGDIISNRWRHQNSENVNVKLYSTKESSSESL